MAHNSRHEADNSESASAGIEDRLAKRRDGRLLAREGSGTEPRRTNPIERHNRRIAGNDRRTKPRRRKHAMHAGIS
jgi:hypothetical protein